MPRSKWIGSALCHQKAECLGKYFLLPKINGNLLIPLPAHLRNLFLLQMSSASTTHQLPGSWEPSLLLSALWTSASNPLVTLHLQTRPLLFIPTGAAMSLLAWTSTTPPKWLPCFHFALSPSSKRSKNVGKVTLTLLLKHSKASHWAWNNSNSLSPTKSYMMRLVSDFPTQHWPLSSWESISLSVDWVDYLPSRLAVKPAGVGNV